MSILRRRHPYSKRALFACGALSLVLLLAAAALFSELRNRVENRYTKIRVGDTRVLEARIPVRHLVSSAPDVAPVEMTARDGLVVRGLRRGYSEITFERADGLRLRYLIAVRTPQARRVPVSLLRPSPKQNVARKRKDAPERRLAVAKKPETPKKVEELKEVRPLGQVVEIDPPAVEERPKDARFLAEYDSKVKEETQARIKNLRRGRPGPPAPMSKALPAPPKVAAQPTPPKPVPERAPAAPKRAGPTPVPTPTASATPKASSPSKMTPSAAVSSQTSPDAAERRPPGGETAPASSAPKLASMPGGQQDPSAAPGLEPDEAPLQPLRPGQRIDLNPSAEALREVTGGGQGGGAGFPDRLQGVKKGDKTFLNTKEWKGASFFNRVKASVAQKWNPAEIYARRDPQGNRYGVKDRYTLVHVTLNTDGSLRNLRVLSPSGIDFLDEEAMGALEAAQPFPNPPAEVKDPDGLIRFSFGFYFEVADKPLFRIFK